MWEWKNSPRTEYRKVGKVNSPRWMWKIRCLNSRNFVAENDDDKLLVISFSFFLLLANECRRDVYVHVCQMSEMIASLIKFA